MDCLRWLVIWFTFMSTYNQRINMNVLKIFKYMNFPEFSTRYLSHRLENKKNDEHILLKNVAQSKKFLDVIFWYQTIKYLIILNWNWVLELIYFPFKIETTVYNIQLIYENVQLAIDLNSICIENFRNIFNIFIDSCLLGFAVWAICIFFVWKS